jgi:MYXO-CTERM domain-containing protein
MRLGLGSSLRFALASVVVGLTLAPGSAAHADCSDPFGKPEEVLDFQIKITRADWMALMVSKVTNVDGMGIDPPGCKDKFPEFKAEFRCGTEMPWLKVALRKKKGEERGAEAVEKPPMKIDINEDFMGMVPTAKGQRWPMALGDLGFRKLTLNNGQSNKPATGMAILPVLHKEHVALRLLHKEVPLAPRTAYAKVTLFFADKPDVGEYRGVYILIEDIDRTALKRRGLSGAGRLEKASTAQCSPELEYDDMVPNAAKMAFDAFVKKQPGSFSGTWVAEASKGLDLDVALRQEAIREIIINGNDTLFNSVNPPMWGNNYLSYDPPGGLRQYIPWDVDLAFGQQFGACMPTPLQCPATVPVLSWCTGPTPYAKTISKLGLALPCNPEVQKRYLQIMCQMTNGSLAPDEILKIWNQVYETLKPIVPLEKAFTWKGVDPMLPPASPGVLTTFGGEYERIKKWIPDRIKFVQQEITRLGVQCSAGCTAGATDSCTYLGCPSMRRCENGRWSACMPNTACLPAAPSTDGGMMPASDAGAPADAASGSGGSSGMMSMGSGGSSGGNNTGGSGSSASSGGNSGGGSSSTGGRAGSGGRATGGSNGSSTPSEDPATPASGCQCSLDGQPQSSGGLSLLGAMALGFFILRRRRAPRA